MGDGTIDYYSRMAAARNAAYANSAEAQQQAFAQEMERQKAADANARWNQLIGVGGIGGTSTGSNSTGVSDAEGRLRQLLDDPESIKQTGSYRFRVGQGQEALQRSMGAKGLLNSGNRLTELTKYGQDMGSQEYENQFGRLSSLLGTYKTSEDRRFGSLAGAFNNGPDTTAMWNAYTAPRTSDVGGGYGLSTAQATGNAQIGAANASANAALQASMWANRR